MNDVNANQRLGLSGQGRDCVVLQVEGMTCGHCANAVEGELAAVPGVVSATVDLGAGTATVVGSASPAGLEGAVERAGYKAVQASGTARPGTARSGGCGCGC